MWNAIGGRLKVATYQFGYQWYRFAAWPHIGHAVDVTVERIVARVSGYASGRVGCSSPILHETTHQFKRENTHAHTHIHTPTRSPQKTEKKTEEKRNLALKKQQITTRKKTAMIAMKRASKSKTGRFFGRSPFSCKIAFSFDSHYVYNKYNMVS